MEKLWIFPKEEEGCNANEEFYIVNCCRNPYSILNYNLNRTRTDWSICIVTHGELFLPLSNEHIQKNHIYFFPPMTYQHVLFKTNSLTYWLHIKGIEVDKIIRELNIPINKPCAITNHNATAILDEIIVEYLTKGSNYEDVSILLAKKFLYAIPREIASTSTNTINSLKKAVSQLYINPRLSNEECAKLCFTTTENFIRVFKAHYQITPHKFKQQLIISHAKELLRQTNYSINNIALMLGFDNNPLYFSNYFKALTGVYPSEYRKKYINEEATAYIPSDK